MNFFFYQNTFKTLLGYSCLLYIQILVIIPNLNDHRFVYQNTNKGFGTIYINI